MSFLKFDYREFVPKTVTCLKEGYSRSLFFNDLIAGLTVGVIALPLAMAFAIGSGLSPEKGLFTAIIAGFLISLLGGSRVQIGGPTGAFVVIVLSVVQRHGYEGLAIATLMAGVMMILMGLARMGVLLKFIPYPVTTGFTTGIALVIFSSQIKDCFELSIHQMPSGFWEKWTLYFEHAHTCNPTAIIFALGTLASIFLLRKFFPKIPGVILAVLGATALAHYFQFPLETIHSKFGGIPKSLPEPSFPVITYDKIQLLFPDAIAIALLGAIESLLSAVIADGMTGHKHRSNGELVAQGIANIGSILFGGIPATGAIARTTANINMGAKTPFAGMIHAVTLGLLMFFLAPWAAQIPLAVLAAVLIFIAWNMSDLPHFIQILKGPPSDAIVLVITFLLTVLIDLTVAVQVGVILAALLFVKRMTDSTTVKICQTLIKEEEHPDLKDSDVILRKDVPSDVQVYEINGPFFFGVADQLNEELRELREKPKVFILRMRKVPLIDATGLHAIEEFQKKCRQKGIVFLISGLRGPVKTLFKKQGLDEKIGTEHLFPHLEGALAYARGI